MSTPSEDNQIDQSLRDIFRDYDLPPDAHPRVWEGVAERIAALPAPSKGLPLRFLLPLTAAVGVGLGWLLPHPAAQPASELATPVRQAVQYAPVSPLAPVAAPLLAVPETPAVAEPATSQAAAPALPVARKPRLAAQARPALSSRPGAAAPTPDSLGLVAQAIVTPEVVVPTDNASAAAPALVPLTTMPLASAATPAAAPAKSSKPTGSHEKIGYRKLTQRQPESRRGIGRWVTRFFQGVRHLLG